MEKSAMPLLGKFTDHPASVGETYLEHMGNAGAFGLRLVVAGAACLTHALLPFLFTTTASREVERLHQRMVLNRRKATQADEGGKPRVRVGH